VKAASVLALVLACRGAPHDIPSNAANIADGVLVPTELDPRITPVTTASGNDARHYYCTPTVAASWNGQLVLYLVGAREDPATAHAFAERACSRGYAALAPVYRNERAIRDLCGDDADCYETARRAIVFGGEAATFLSVDPANSLLHRVDVLAAHLAKALPEVWGPIRDRLARRDFSGVVVAGFSQGTGHVLILAHDFGVARLVMLSGVPDRIHSGDADQAAVTWIARWRDSDPKTPGERMFGINHTADPFIPAAELAANYALLGVPDATCEVGEDRPSGECHRFVIHTEPCPDAHMTPSLASFGAPGAPCRLDGMLRHLGPTWDYVLSPH
jgi:dienelactone hydrolase